MLHIGTGVLLCSNRATDSHMLNMLKFNSLLPSLFWFLDGSPTYF